LIQNPNSQRDLVSTATITDTTSWHFVVGTWDGSTQRLYIDGVQDPSTISWSGSLLTTTNTFSIGRLGGLDLYYFAGLIDDVRVYNRALSATEVAGLYGGSSATHVNTSSANLQNGTTLGSGLVGLWTFDGGDSHGTTAYDRSGQNNNGTIGNGANPTIGKLGQGLAFNPAAAGPGVFAAYSASLGITGTITLSAWIKTSSTASQIIMSRWGDTNSYALQVDNFFGTDRLNFYLGNVATLRSTAAVFSDGKWHLEHISAALNRGIPLKL
jgi:concanavalin A-like lectin/glucanase superfamily protein